MKIIYNYNNDINIINNTTVQMVNNLINQNQTVNNNSNIIIENSTNKSKHKAKKKKNQNQANNNNNSNIIIENSTNKSKHKAKSKKNIQETPQVKIVNLDQTNNLLFVDTEKLPFEPVKLNIRRKFFFILDRSGSMEGYFELFIKLLPNLMNKLHVRVIKLFTFDSKNEVYNLTLNEAKKLDIKNRGCTSLNGTIDNLVHEINKDKHNCHIQLLFVSDGELDDKNKVLINTKNLANKIDKRHKIHVVGVRLNTSKYGSPDTKAITCINSIHNIPHIQPTLIEIPYYKNFDPCHQPEIIQSSAIMMKEIYDKFCLNQIIDIFNRNRISNDGFLLNSSILNLKTEVSSQFTNAIRLLKGKNIIIINSPINNLTINEVALDIIECKNVSEEDLTNFLKTIESRVRNYKVMGTQEEKLEQIRDFMLALKTHFETYSNNQQETKLKPQARFKQILRMIKKRSNSYTDKILQLLNLKKIHELNSLQQAAFLQELCENKKSKRIVGRSRIKNKEQFYDLVKKCQEEFKSKFNRIKKKEEKLKLITSFYTLSDNSDIYEIMIDEKEISLLSVQEMLECFGLTGICFNAEKKIYQEPWAFLPTEVYYNCYLSQNDLHCALIQGKGELLEAPGIKGSKITGVAPIYTGQSWNLLKFWNNIQASVILRNSITYIVDDPIAITTGVLWRMSITICKKGLNECREKDFGLMLKTLRYQSRNGAYFINKSKKINLIEDLGRKNVAAYLTGDRNIPHVMKIISCLLSIDTKDLDLPRIFRALYSFQCYHYVRRIINREQKDSQVVRNELLSKISNIKIPTDQELIKNILDNNPVIWNSQYSLQDIHETVEKYKISPHNLICVYRMLQWLEKGGEIKKNYGTEENIKNCFGINMTSNNYITINTVQALTCPNTSYRVDTEKREFLIPLVTTETESNQYIENIIKEHYKTYNKKLRGRKRDIANKIIVNSLTGVETDFIIKDIETINNIRENYKDFISVEYNRAWERVLDCFHLPWMPTTKQIKKTNKIFKKLDEEEDFIIKMFNVWDPERRVIKEQTFRNLYKYVKEINPKHKLEQKRNKLLFDSNTFPNSPIFLQSLFTPDTEKNNINNMKLYQYHLGENSKSGFMTTTVIIDGKKEQSSWEIYFQSLRNVQLWNKILHPIWYNNINNHNANSLANNYYEDITTDYHALLGEIYCKEYIRYFYRKVKGDEKERPHELVYKWLDNKL